MKNYIDIKISDPDICFIFPKLIAIVHGYLQEHNQAKLALAFPLWKKTENKKVNLGNLLRLFGNSEDIITFLNQPPIVLFIKRNAIVVSSINETPKTEQFVRFSRDRSSEKKTEHYKFKREMKNKEYRRTHNIIELPKDKKNKQEYIENYFFKLTSKSTHQENFSLIIKKTQSLSLSNSFSTYGLSNDLQNGGVPFF